MGCDGHRDRDNERERERPQLGGGGLERGRQAVLCLGDPHVLPERSPSLLAESRSRGQFGVSGSLGVHVSTHELTGDFARLHG